ncbi:MAG: glutamate--tRNA ligase [Actinobacteria bacterium]|nr:MAG: glutamate--tRNA ligase [Actinomycetota bacterium]
MTTRVRFAPAPSGSIHVGNARTALFNWLYARHNGGVMVLRVEDTDRSRVTEESYRAVLEDLRWLGLDWDEGPEAGGPYAPYRQSERLDIYRGVIDQLLLAGLAYPCYCTPEELEERRKAAMAAGRRPGYDGRCYRLTDAERSKFEAEHRPYVIRFHVPEEGSTTFHDLVTGYVTVDHAQIDDFVLVRRDGFPLYNLAAPVDDGMMHMTHVIRGLDLQPSTPRQILLHDALGNEIPEFGHLPLILGADGQPLSKRHGEVSVGWYRDHGFLPEAIVNYLALLGWSPRDGSVILPLSEIVAQFRLEDVGASPARFDLDKLTWMNGEYIRSLPDEELARRLEPFLVRVGLVADPPTEAQRSLVAAIVPLVKTRIERLDQAAPLVAGIFRDVPVDPAAAEKVLGEDYVPELLERSVAALERLGTWDREGVEAALRGVQTEMGLKPKKAFVPFYVAVLGSNVGAPIFDSMALIGRDKVLDRLRQVREKFLPGREPPAEVR